MSKYAAFISYRHGGIDEQVAIQIHKEIERYRLPKKIAREKGIKTLGKLFRDAEARLRTSPATTAKPLPAVPARAASTAALSARMLV